MKSKKTLAAFIGFVATLVLLVAPTASAHTPYLTASLDCNGKVSWTFSTDGWGAHFTISDSVYGQQGQTMTISGPSYSLSGSYTVPTSVTSGSVTASITWDDGYTANNTVTATYTPVTNCTSITTTLSSSSVAAGTAVHDSATLHGQTSHAGGTVTYKAYTDSSCTQGAQDAGTKTVTNGNVPDSDPITFNSAGDYYWQAVYSGDASNNSSTSACTDEHLVVTKRSPSISTTLSSSTIAVGGTIHDSASLTGATSNAGGTVTYTVYTNTNCSGGGQDAGTKTVTNGNVPDSNPITFNSAGDSYWQAVYSGDANNNTATSACTSEHLVVNKKTPTIATLLSASTITAGGTVNDTATLSGATSTAGGTVTYSVYTNTTCTGGAQDAGTKTVTNGVVPNSNTLTFNTAGDYYWQASYSGDANNAAAKSVCTSEHLVVSSPPPPQSPAISISKNPKSQTIQSGSTASFSITVTNSGNVTLTNVTVSDPQSPDCSKTSSNIPALASMAPGASVSYNCSLANVTSNFTNVATATGTPPSGANVTANDSATVTVTVPPLAPTHPAIGIVKDPTSQSVTLGGTANFKITVTNTGDVTLSSVTVTDPLSPDCNRDLGTLTAGQSKSYTCTSTNVRKDFRNVATATGQPPTGPSVSADDSADVNVAFTPPKPKPENPKITIVKSPKQQNVTTKATNMRSTAGATRTTIEYGSAHFTITVKNTGDVKLHSVVVTDPLSKSCERQLGALAPGASRTYRCVRNVVSSGFTNVASASGLSPKGKKVQDSDHAVVTVTVKNTTTGSDISAGKHQTSKPTKPTTPTTPLTPPKTTASGSPSFTG